MRLVGYKAREAVRERMVRVRGRCDISRADLSIACREHRCQPESVSSPSGRKKPLLQTDARARGDSVAQCVAH